MTRNTVCTACTPSSAWTTSNPSRVSTDDTMRRRVGLSSAITTVGIGATLSSPDETAHGLDELVLVEFCLQQVRTRAGLETCTLVVVAAARGHDDHRHLLPPARAADGAGQRKAVHAGHLDVGDDEVGRVVLQPRGAVQPVDGRHDVVTGAFEDDPLELADTDRVLDDEDPGSATCRLAPAGRFREVGARDGRAPDAVGHQLTQVDETHDGAVTVDRRAAHQRQPAEEGTHVLDDELQLALETIDGPGDLPVGVPHHYGRLRLTAAGGVEGRAEVEK